MRPLLRARAWLALSVVLAITMAGCGAQAESETTALLFTEAQVQRTDMAEVIEAWGQVSALQDRWLSYDTVSGRLLDVAVEVGQEVAEGDVIARLDTAPLERQLREAEADLSVAEAVLRDAEADASPAMVQQAEADLLAAQYELQKAAMDLQLAGTLAVARLEQEVADRRYDVQVAQDRLALAELTSHAGEIRQFEYDEAFFQRALRDLPPDQDRAEIEESLANTQRALNAARTAREAELRSARDAVRKANEELQKALVRLENATASGSDPEAEARLAYEQARAKVEKATERVEQVRVGPDPTALEAAQTGYDAALAKVESAQAAIDAAALRAPFAGIIFAVNAASGDLVGMGDQIAYLVAPDALRLTSGVPEVDVVKLQVGQPVRIRFEAYADHLLEGEVLEVSPRGEQQGGLMIFPLKISFDRGGLDVRTGMTARLRVVIGEQKNVLAVPSAALRQSQTGGLMVQVRTPGGTWEDREVTIGMNDGLLAEVLSGLEEGQTIRYPLQEPSEQSPFGRMPGGVQPVEGEAAPTTEEGTPPGGEEGAAPVEGEEGVAPLEGETPSLEEMPSTSGARESAPAGAPPAKEPQPRVLETPAAGSADDSAQGK